jgi:hypothetical protein
MEDGRILGARGHLHGMFFFDFELDWEMMLRWERYDVLTPRISDGGVKMDLFINDKWTCASEAIYGERAGSSETSTAEMAGHPHESASSGSSSESSSGESIKTISAMTRCQGPIPVKQGDTLTLRAVYDLSLHPLRQSASGGKAADVMGMWGISFAADKKNWAT